MTLVLNNNPNFLSKKRAVYYGLQFPSISLHDSVSFSTGLETLEENLPLLDMDHLSVLAKETVSIVWLTTATPTC